MALSGKHDTTRFALGSTGSVCRRRSSGVRQGVGVAGATRSRARGVRGGGGDRAGACARARHAELWCEAHARTGRRAAVAEMGRGAQGVAIPHAHDAGVAVDGTLALLLLHAPFALVRHNGQPCTRSAQRGARSEQCARVPRALPQAHAVYG